MKRVLSNILFILVICISAYLLVANVLHVFYLNKHDVYDFGNQNITEIKNEVNELKLNIEKIAVLNNNVFSKDEINSITGTLRSAVNSIEDSKILKYEGEQKIYFKDLMDIDFNEQLSRASTINLLKSISDRNDSIEDYLELHIYNYVSNMFNYDSSVQEVIQAYKYNTIDIFNQGNIEAINSRILARVYRLGSYVKEQNYIAKMLLKIGGANNE